MTPIEALRELYDEQNDAPLERRRKQWKAAMDNARAVLAEHDDAQPAAQQLPDSSRESVMRALRVARGALLEVTPCIEPECKLTQQDWIETAVSGIDRVLTALETQPAAQQERDRYVFAEDWGYELLKAERAVGYREGYEAALAQRKP